MTSLPENIPAGRLWIEVTDLPSALRALELLIGAVGTDDELLSPHEADTV